MSAVAVEAAEREARRLETGEAGLYDSNCYAVVFHREEIWIALW